MPLTTKNNKNDTNNDNGSVGHGPSELKKPVPVNHDDQKGVVGFKHMKISMIDHNNIKLRITCIQRGE